tara:strand:- start:93 stop:476 length:384 start_codon:yes stop_codon:yes gene_type:complete
VSKFYLIFISIFLLNSCSSTDNKLQEKYIKDLHNWINNPEMDNSSIRQKVQAPCSKLTMVMATASEKKSFITHENIDEYDFRAGFCMSAVIENVVPNQPGFTKEFKRDICKESIPFIRLICKEFIKY